MPEYATLTDSDKLLIARDTLRGRESDRFRVSILSEPNKEERLAEYDEEIATLRTVVTDLEAKVKASNEPAKPAK